ncbi:peptide ABC transporter substrate-binding protein [Traorella massiliensis]|uniref:peptide ABC transporter substrate-binding protein n=1 Tax=Traorella massiliensis TaxID=1903263 RepID=UPI002353084D|nr:peptide ABC transporter substrate-binding protein [Traorella massiliensis]
MKNILKRFSYMSLAAMMTLTLTACGGDGGETTGTLADTFTYAIGGEPEQLDPAVGSDSVTSYILNQTYYPLFTIAEDGSLRNEACEDYEVSEDGLTYTFHLIENNYWSDGEQVTAHDYVYGMKRSIGMGAADSYYSYFLADYVLNAKAHNENMSDVADMGDVGIVATDDFTIEITLESPCPYFVNLMTAGVFYPLREEFSPEHDSSWANDPTVPTNGAYQTTKIDSADEIIMVKNEYFAHADDVVTQTLVAKVMSDPDAQLVAFQTGEIDFAANVNNQVTTVYEGQPELLISDSVMNYYIMLNAYSEETPALQDVRVRRAIQLGIDRTELVTALDADEVYYELYGYVPKGFDGVNGDFREEADEENQLVYTDKDEARSLMEAAGYSEDNHLQLTYYTNQAAEHSTVAQVIQAQLADIYIDVTLKTGEIRTFFDDRENGLFDMARGAMSADYMDVSTFLDMAASWTQYGHVTWGDETYDQMITESRETSDNTQRLELLHDAETYLVEEMAYTVPLFGYKQICLGQQGVSGYVSSPQGNHVFWYVQVVE